MRGGIANPAERALEEGQHRHIGTACVCCWPSSRTEFTLDAMPHVEHVFDVHDVGLAQFDPFLGSCWSSTSIHNYDTPPKKRKC